MGTAKDFFVVDDHGAGHGHVDGIHVIGFVKRQTPAKHGLQGFHGGVRDFIADSNMIGAGVVHVKNRPSSLGFTSVHTALVVDPATK